MTTPARRHQMRVMAELAAKAAGPGDEVRGSAYELMLAQLAEHKRTLKTIQSTERKIEAKRKMLPDFEEYVTGALEGGQAEDSAELTEMADLFGRCSKALLSATQLSATDQEALDAFQLCAELEGIIPALESAHAMARLGDITRQVGKDGVVVLLLSGRGDKDIFAVAEHLGRKI